MESCYKLVVFGVAGRGKSTLLNYLLLPPELAEDEDFQSFKSDSGGESCTKRVDSCQGVILGTNIGIEVYDTPGSFSLDTPLNKWFDTICEGKLPNPFHALLWVIDIT